MISRGNIMPSTMSNCEAAELKALARQAILNKDANNLLPRFIIPEYQLHRGVFVTLRQPDGSLRGCIGTWSGENTILDNVVRYARAAAFEDNRFPPLDPSSEKFTIEITFLEKRRLIPGGYEKFLKAWMLGRDGVILELGGRQAIFLPSVPIEFGWNKKQTLEHLAEKAMLAADSWMHPAAKLYLIPGYDVGRKFNPQSKL